MTAELIARAATIAIELGHPLKDCVYLALALDLGCPLLTADAKFHARTSPTYPVEVSANRTFTIRRQTRQTCPRRSVRCSCSARPSSRP